MTDFQKLFPDNRHTGDTDLRKAQLVMLRMLKIVDYICRENNITYWLDSGTLLGAVRHQGFIPWDDDLDIAMPREDYEQFLAIAKDALPEDLFLQTLEADPGYKGYGCPCKIRDNNSSIVESYVKEENNYHHGICMDVFPMDKFRNSFPGYDIDYFFKRIFLWLYLFQYVQFHKGNGFKNSLKNLLTKLKKIIPAESLIKKYNKFLIKRIEKSKLIKDNYFIDYGFDLTWAHHYAPRFIFPLKQAKFEDTNFFVPAEESQILEILYGKDYLTPKKTKYSSHLVKVVVDKTANITQKPIEERSQ